MDTNELNPKHIEEVVRRELQLITPCPQWAVGCVTGRAISSNRCSDNCSIYGCNVEREHSALDKIYHELGVNGDLGPRRKVIGVLRQEISSGRFSYKE